MGEAILRKLIAEKIGCSIDELDEKGVSIMSAGIAAMSGGGPAGQAVEVMREQGLNIEKHSSQPLTDRLAKLADYIFTMTGGHRHAVVNAWPETASRTHLVCRDGADVSDPIGQSVGVYQSTAEQIESNLKDWVSEIDFSTFIS